MRRVVRLSVLACDDPRDGIAVKGLSAGHPAYSPAEVRLAWVAQLFSRYVTPLVNDDDEARKRAWRSLREQMAQRAAVGYYRRP